MSLNPRQQRFAELYAASGNATQAYKEAYGCTDEVAGRNGHRLLKNAEVDAIIQHSRAKAAEKAGETVERILADLREIAEIGMKRRTVDGVDPNLPAAKGALELIGKHLGMFEDRTRDMTPQADIDPEPEAGDWAAKYQTSKSSDRSPARKPH